MKTRLGVLNMKVMMHPLLVHPHLRLLLVLITQTSITVLSASSDDLSEATFLNVESGHCFWIIAKTVMAP